MQFMERRLPTLAELDAVNRPVYIQAAQGGTRTNSQGKAWLEAKGVMVAADGAITGPALNAALSNTAQRTANAGDQETIRARCPELLREAGSHHASRLRRISFGSAFRRRCQ